MNFAVALVPPAVDTDWPMPRASEEENASTIIIPGWCRSRPCLDSSLNMTPELEIITSDEMSYLSGDASRARSIGLAKASPTIAMALTPSRSMRSEEHTSELQSLMRISYAVFCLKKKNIKLAMQH